MPERMYENYKKNIVNSLQEKFKYKNVIITSSSAKKIQQRVLNEKN